MGEGVNFFGINLLKYNNPNPQQQNLKDFNVFAIVNFLNINAIKNLKINLKL